MLTRKNFNRYINQFLNELGQAGVQPTRVVLFGSYAKGNVHDQSDIDLAIWADSFTGFTLEDTIPSQTILSQFPLIQLRTFKTGQTSDFDPFLEEIINTGKELSLENVDFSFA